MIKGTVFVISSVRFVTVPIKLRQIKYQFDIHVFLSAFNSFVISLQMNLCISCFRNNGEIIKSNTFQTKKRRFLPHTFGLIQGVKGYTVVVNMTRPSVNRAGHLKLQITTTV